MLLAPKKFWIVFTLLMVSGIGATLWWRHDATEQRLTARFIPYPFAVSHQAPDIEQEIHFYQQRVEQNEEGSDRATLAAAYLKKAQLLEDPRWYRKAELMARHSLEKLPHFNPTARLVLAQVAEARHRFAQAIAHAEAILAEAPHQLEAWALLVTAHLGSGHLEEAERCATLLVKRMPRSGPFALRALVRLKQGREREALADFERAAAVEDIGEEETASWWRSLLGRFYLERGQLGLARQFFNEALRIRPGYHFALEQLAEPEEKAVWTEAARK